MKKYYFKISFMVFVINLFSSNSFAQGANDALEVNCKAVSEYNTGLTFNMTKNWKEGEDPNEAIVTYYTNRKTLINILSHFQLDEEKNLKIRLTELTKKIEKAPSYEAAYTENTWFDLAISKNLFSLLCVFIDDVSKKFNCSK